MCFCCSCDFVIVYCTEVKRVLSAKSGCVGVISEVKSVLYAKSGCECIFVYFVEV